MRIACPFSSGITLTSAMTDPAWPRMGSTSIGFVESNSSHTVSARRNNAAGVAAGNENVTRRPSLSRLAITPAGLSADLISAGGAGGAIGIFGGASAMAGIFGGASTVAAGDSCGRASVAAAIKEPAAPLTAVRAVEPPAREASAVPVRG